MGLTKFGSAAICYVPGQIAGWNLAPCNRATFHKLELGVTQFLGDGGEDVWGFAAAEATSIGISGGSTMLNLEVCYRAVIFNGDKRWQCLSALLPTKQRSQTRAVIALNVNFKEQRHSVLCKKIRTRQGRDLEGASSVWWGRGRKAGVMTAAGCLDLSVLPGMGDLVVFSAGLECIFGGVWSWEQVSSRVLGEHIGV